MICVLLLLQGMADLMPASFLIDWVRVYQDPEDPTQVRRYFCRYFQPSAFQPSVLAVPTTVCHYIGHKCAHSHARMCYLVCKLNVGTMRCYAFHMSHGSITALTCCYCYTLLLQTVGCDTPAMPTSKWIRGHSKRYMDPGETMYKRPVPHGGGWCYSDPSEAAAAAASAATAPALNVSRSSNSGKAKGSGGSDSSSPTAAAAGHRRATEELSPSSSSSSSDLPFPASWYDTVSSDSSSSSSDSDSDAAAQDSGASRLDSSSSSSSSDAAQKRKRKKHADDAAAAGHHAHADSRTDKADSSATSSMGGGGSGSSASSSEDAEHERAWWERMGHGGESRELDCGGGSCVSNRCVCPPSWSGPHCRAPNGFDDAPGADGQKGASLPLPPSPPLVPRVFAALFALLCLGFGATLALRTSHRLSGRAYANLDDILPLVPMHNPLLDEQGLFERTDCHSSPLPALALQRS
jgi:EGF-like domain